MPTKAEQSFYSFASRAEDALTALTYGLWKPIARRKGLDMVFTKTPEERVQFLTELFIMVREHAGIKEIRFAAGGDDGDLDEFAEALLLSGVCLSDDVVKHLRVTATPAGPAPEDIRNAWNGIEFIGIKLPGLIGPEIDFVTGELAPVRETYAVYAPYAIAKLGGFRPEAAAWFSKNFPKDVFMLTFGADEVEVIDIKE